MPRSRRRTPFLLLASVSLGAVAAGPRAPPAVDEDRPSPVAGAVVHGAVPGLNMGRALRRQRIEQNGLHLTTQAPLGSPLAGVQGTFGPVNAWPSVPIHMVLTPDRRLVNFGATSSGKQGGFLDYAVWDPSIGVGADALLLLPNTTQVNNFCSAQWLLPESGDVLTAGGTQVVNNVSNVGINDVLRFATTTNTLTATTPMQYRRWYATTLGTLDGEVLALDGRIDPPELTGDKITVADTPELYNPRTATWRALPGARSESAYGFRSTSWFYPRAWLAPDGSTFVLSHAGSMYRVTTQGDGSIAVLPGSVPVQNAHMSSAMYQPGKIIAIRDARLVALIDINGPTPRVSVAQPISRHRRFGSATLLADGRLFVNGGTEANDNVLEGAHLESEIWDPATGQWTTAATAALARLYHSNAVLLPDATVLTGGGGLPGPLTNMNTEIYYPPYLYKKDGSGSLMPRPALDTRTVGLGWNQAFDVKFSSAKPIARVTLVGTGQATHAFNVGQRFQSLPFSASAGNWLRLRTPASRTQAPAGYYLLFAIDTDGVPSQGKVIRIFE